VSRSDDVVDGVKQMILDGRLQPGERLPAEKELAAALGVSRGSLREGVRALVQHPLDHDRLVDADLAFHEEIARASGNPVLAALVEGLAGRTSRTRLWRGLSDEGAEDRAFVEHEAILAALAARDPDRARLRMATHLLGLEDSATGARAPWED